MNTTSNTISVGAFPFHACFDGENIWVANLDSDNVTKIHASTGAVVGTFPQASLPGAVCSDGLSIWVANLTADTVTKLRGHDRRRSWTPST